jgi:hypothetical protein
LVARGVDPNPAGLVIGDSTNSARTPDSDLPALNRAERSRVEADSAPSAPTGGLGFGHRYADHSARRHNHLTLAGIWGIHGRRPDFEMVRDRMLQLERAGVGDLHQLGDDRARVFDRLRASYPREREGTLRNWTTVLLRFAFAPAVGDLVVHPDPRRRTFSLGRLGGPYRFTAGERELHERDVEWLLTGVPRDRLSAEAAADIAQRPAFFEVKQTGDEFAALTRGRAAT